MHGRVLGLVFLGAALAQPAVAQSGRAILGEWSMLCGAPQMLGFEADPAAAGKLRRYYIRDGRARADVEDIKDYAEDKDFIRLKFASGEELVYKRVPEGIKEWYRRLPGHDPMTKDGKTEIPVSRLLIDTVPFKRCR